MDKEIEPHQIKDYKYYKGLNSNRWNNQNV